MKKYLSEITDVNKIDYELFNGFMESIGLSGEVIEEINNIIEETNKKIKEKFTYGDVESLMIDKIDKRDVIETVTPSTEAVEEINRLIEESNKPVKKPFPYGNIDNITINEVGDWNIGGINYEYRLR